MSRSEVHLDMRGQQCPKPVMETKKALDSILEGVVRVVVDAEGSRSNIVRAATSAGLEVTVEEGNGEWTIAILKEAAAEAAQPETATADRPPAPEPRRSGTVFLIAGKGMGRGDDELAHILIKSCLYTLTQREVLPRAVVMVNFGVRLVCEGSDCIEHLQALQERGVQIIACGTCLDYFGWMDQVEVGVVSNMYEIVETLDAAAKVITL